METTLGFHSLFPSRFCSKARERERGTLFSDAMRQPLGREGGHGVVYILRVLDPKYFFSEDRSI